MFYIHREDRSTAASDNGLKLSAFRYLPALPLVTAGAIYVDKGGVGIEGDSYFVANNALGDGGKTQHMPGHPPPMRADLRSHDET